MLERLSEKSTTVETTHIARSGRTHDGGIVHSETTTGWLLIIREYTKCKLTRDEDILIALSGLSRRWDDKIPVQYFADLWKQSLAEGLL